MTIFQNKEQSHPAYSLPKNQNVFKAYTPSNHLVRQEEMLFPQLSELSITRHFSNLERKNMGIDTHFYPLGSCTMKLNPRINEVCARLSGFSHAHPLAEDIHVQGCLELMDGLNKLLCEVCGMDGGTLVPNAGAQGELCGIQMIAAYHKSRNDHKRDEILIPQSAHGTNPATASLAGFKVVGLKGCPEGDVDLEDLKAKVSERTAGLMLTNPSTLGQFSSNILDIAKVIHDAGGLLYYDGANLNPILEVARPGAMGFDVMHINLHKTFSTPHGGGGPGGAPVLCKKKLIPYLPSPSVVKSKDTWCTEGQGGLSIGHLASFRGNFSVLVRAFLYSKLHGKFGLRRIAEYATLNANYLKFQIKSLLTVPFSAHCMHEFVCQVDSFLDKKIRAIDVAKRLLDYGFHAPTVYFPLIIKECFLIEPTETESKETLDDFIDALRKIIKEIETDPELVRTAPHTTPVRRLDEVRAAKNPILHGIGEMKS